MGDDTNPSGELGEPPAMPAEVWSAALRRAFAEGESDDSLIPPVDDAVVPTDALPEGVGDPPGDGADVDGTFAIELEPHEHMDVPRIDDGEFE